MGEDRFQLYAARKLPTVNFDVLTDEEGDILRARCKGNPTYTANLLHMSVETVHRRQRMIQKKLGV
jgi:DNA-binding NarL/FixJ family response regulator